MNIFAQSVLQLFSDRDSAYNELTKTLTSQIDFVFEGIIEYLQINAHNVGWESVDLYDDMIAIVARIEIVDAIIETPSSFKILTIGIPITLLETESSEAIVSFLRDIESTKPKSVRQMNLDDHKGSLNDVDEGDIDSEILEALSVRPKGRTLH